MKDFIDYLVSLAPEGETLLLVKQQPIGNGQERHADGSLKCTWPAFLPNRSKAKAGEPWYANTASFITSRLERKKISAATANCEDVLVMVLDDIGTKSKIPPLPPTWIIETSKDNYQYGYAFSTRPDKGSFTAAVTAIAEAGYTDPGATNAVRNFRIPGSSNIKEGKNNFLSRLVELNKDRKYTLLQICEALDVTPGDASTHSMRPIKLGRGITDPALAWLNEQGLVLSEINREGWAEVVCPNKDEHTDGASSARYNPSDRGFICFHSHCTHLDSAAFFKWIESEGGPKHAFGLDTGGLQPVMKAAMTKVETCDQASPFKKQAEKEIILMEAKESARMEKSGWYDRYAYIMDNDSYFDIIDRSELSRKAFNAIFRHVNCRSIHNERKVEASICYDENRQVRGAKILKGVTYAAGDGILVPRDGELYGNMWKDARPNIDKTKKADIDMWLQHCEDIILDDNELDHIWDVMAFKLQNPHIKINHAILHGSDEGAGKDTMWAPFLWAVCGPSLLNRGIMSTASINSNWGYQLQSEILLINELKEPNAADRRALANTLKPIIAAPPATIPIERKGLHPYMMANRMMVLAFTNDPVPISLSRQDRRWFCVWSPNNIMQENKALAMWHWYNHGGFEAIAAWLYQRDVSQFNPAAAPKMTEFKANMLELGMSSTESFLVELIKSRNSEFATGVVSGPFHGLCDRLAGMAPPSMKIYQAALLHALKEAGWVDCGRIASTQYQTKKHVFATLELARSKSKSELRNMVELVPENSKIRLLAQ